MNAPSLVREARPVTATLLFLIGCVTLMMTGFAVIILVFPLVLGRLSETLPKKPLIVTGSLLFSALFVFLLAAPLYPLLIAGAALAGLGSALVEPSMGGIYLAATSDENRGQIMGIRGSAISLAVMLGPLVQALVGLWITPQITFAIGIALVLTMAVVAFLLLKNSGRAQNV